MDGWVDTWMNNGWMHGGWMGELMDGQAEGQLTGWMNKALFRENSLDGLSY